MIDGIKAYLDNERLRKEEESPINRAMIERNDKAIKNDLDAFKIIINKRVNILLLLDSFIYGVGYYNENTQWVYLKLTYDEWEFLRKIILYRHLSNENEHKIINDLQEQLYKALDLEIPKDLLSNARVNIENVKATLIPTKIEKSMLEPKVYYDDKEIQARLEAFKKEKPILMPMDDEIGLKTIVDNINGAVAKKTSVVFIEDIIDIYNNKYYNYERYLDYKKILRETSKNEIDLQEDNLAGFMALNIEVPTLSKELFDLILEKRKKDYDN